MYVFVVPSQAIRNTRRIFFGLKIHTFILPIALTLVKFVFIKFGRWKYDDFLILYAYAIIIFTVFVFFAGILDLPKTYCSIQGGHISGILVSRMSNPGA